MRTTGVVENPGRALRSSSVLPTQSRSYPVGSFAFCWASRICARRSVEHQQWYALPSASSRSTYGV